MKLSPTYGATPATVGTIPLYNAVMPPSLAYMCFIVPHMPGSLRLATSAAFLAESPFSLAKDAKDADWIERRVRTMSSGYVTVTEVIPARAPQQRRESAERFAPGVDSKPCCVID